MTSEQFTYWLQGFLEISGTKEIGPEQVQIIKDHLDTVFVKVTPTRTLSGQPVPKNPPPHTRPLEEILDEIHKRALEKPPEQSPSLPFTVTCSATPTTTVSPLKWGSSIDVKVC